MKRVFGFVGLGLLAGVLGTVRAGDVPKLDLSDADVLKAIAKGRRVPKGFAAEELKAGPKESISISWVRQLKPDKRRFVYVAANSAGEAKKLTQEYLNRSNVPAEAKKIVGEEKTKAYYQFKTKHKIGDNTYWTYLRVWNGGFFQPGDDLGTRYLGERGTYKIGKLTGPRDAETARWLAEFLWWTDNHNMVGAYVLAAPKTWEDRTNFKVLLPTAQVVRGDFGVADVIHEIRWELSVNRKSGEVSQTIQEVRSLQGKRNPGGVIKPR